MLKKLLRRQALLAVAVTTAVSAFAADKVTFTRHAYEEGGYVYRTYAAQVPFATQIKPSEDSDSNIYKFTLLSETLEPIHSFSITPPDGIKSSTLWFAGFKPSEYIQEILVTQHLFNDDDLYEVLFNDMDKSVYVVYNEKGECLGECPSYRIYEVGNEVYLYREYESSSENPNRSVSALYSINKGGASVSSLKANDAKFQVMPNPAKDDEMITVTLPGAAPVDVIIKVFSIDGRMLVQRECKQGMQSVTVPAGLLTSGVNPVVAFDADGNVVCSGKIIRD